MRRSPLLISSVAVALAFLFPFYWIFAQSMQSSKEFSLGQPRFWPRHPTLENYRDILANDGFARALANSFLVSVAVAAFTVDRKSTRLNSSHEWISYAVFCL